MVGLLPPRRILLFAVGLGLLGLAVLAVVGLPTMEESSSGGVTWEPPLEVASGAGVRGPWRMNESNWQFVDDPTVALASDGTAGVVWADHTRNDLFFQAFGPGGDRRLETPTNVSQTPETFSWLPRMVFSPRDSDTVSVLWQEIIFSGGTHGGDILFARSTDGGRTFNHPVNLSQSEAGDGKGRLSKNLWHNGSLDLALGPDRDLYAAWTEYEGRLWLSRSTNGGQRFTDPIHVAGTNERPVRGPALAIGSSGAVHLAWAVGEDPRADIQYTRSTDVWNDLRRPKPVAQSTGHSDAPKLAVDSAGTVHLAYGERPSGHTRESHVRYTQSKPDTSFAEPVVLVNGASDASVGAHFPALQIRPGRSLHVMWELFPEGQNRPRALGYTSSDGGNTFAPPSVLPGSDTTRGFNGSQQGLLMEKLAVNASGDLAVVNSTFRQGRSSHIWLYRGQSEID